MDRTYIRKLAGLLLVFSGILVIFTGIILFVMPHGKIAYWTGWTFLKLNKDQWSDLHIMLSLLFIIALGLHIWVNWRPFCNYFFKKSSICLGKSFWTATIITLVTVAITIAGLPPASQIISLEKNIKQSWVTEYNQPPIPHAELLPLKKLAKLGNVSPQLALTRLKDKGWKVESVSEKVKKICKINRHRPVELWDIITGSKR